jgi:phosphate transport system substrate-binding protein
MASSLTGAGGTFPQPLYTKWFDVYNQQFGVQINYQGVGSGAGINQITAGTVDFGASDAIMTATQEAAATAAGGKILHVPTTLGAVAVIYNIPGVTQLNLTGEALANIYLKTIKNWNDPAITALNPGVNLPNTAIAVVHRSDSSGTSNIFTNYLDKVSTAWDKQVGWGQSVSWPGDIGGEKNAGVAAQVQQIAGGIGYVELAYALQNNLTYAKLKNAAGNFVAPTLESTPQPRPE